MENAYTNVNAYMHMFHTNNDRQSSLTHFVKMQLSRPVYKPEPKHDTNVDHLKARSNQSNFGL